MTHDQWQMLQTLFDLIDDTPPAERRATLEKACADPQLRERVLRMVEGANLDADAAAATPPPAPFAPAPSRMGPYHLLRVIGSGGMGTVYLAERMLGGAPQRVALKILAPHAAGAQFVERFHREQHILAVLDHPHITRLLDAGMSETGQPYLVTELVDGVHLDEYCDAQCLSIDARVKIFVHVCDAVSHAHRNLIVHLDLKPSNILVNTQGSVKLLDFGTSKLIETDRSATTTILATPAYASPEQLRNEPVTTACDVYSLGAVLSRLLAGDSERSHGSTALAIERAFKETEPERLSSAVTDEAARLRGSTQTRLRRALGGDLATVVAKCMRPRAKDRYASVDALQEDLKRYLAGHPVMARPQTPLYLAGKWFRRHRLSASLTGLLLMALAATALYAGWRQDQALREGRRALNMQTFVYRLFKLANANHTGKPGLSVSEFLQLGVSILPDYIKNPADLRQAQLGLAESLYENGDFDRAREVFGTVAASASRAADVAAQAEAEAFAGNIDYLKGQVQSGASLTAHALALSNGSNVPAAVKVWSDIYYAWNRENNGFRSDENVRLLKSAVEQARHGHLSARETADALYNWGSDLELRGNLSEASAVFREVLGVYANDPAALCEQSEVYGDLAYIDQMQGDIGASLPLYEKAYAGYVTCAGADSRGALTEQEFLAGDLVKLGRAPEALTMMEKAIPIWRKLEGNSPELSEPLNFLTLAELATGHAIEAEGHAKEMVDLQTGKVDAGDRRFGASHLLWARALMAQQRDGEALTHARIAVDLLGRNAVSAGAKQTAAEARQLLREIESRPHSDAR